ncbi:hypothetical protein C8R44DRAFT_741065 [Mycena epipterygia]|nr:hypothetical protein C8R44DRAFT_741065 [Mycena epipterygia]
MYNLIRGISLRYEKLGYDSLSPSWPSVLGEFRILLTESRKLFSHCSTWQKSDKCIGLDMSEYQIVEINPTDLRLHCYHNPSDCRESGRLLGLGKLEKRTKDDEDPSERGRALISSPEGWRTEMAKWIGDARAAQRTDEEADAEDDTNETSAPPPQKSAWKSLTLQKLF